jgi:biopolymer transport protein ExbD
MSRLPSTFRVGLTLIPLGLLWCLGCWQWEASRIWVPLDIPVSLAQGHIQSAEFEINVAGLYKVVLDPSRSENHVAPCLTPAQCSLGAFDLTTAWSLSKEKRVVARGNSDFHDPDGEPNYYGLGTFQVEKGRYSLDVDVLKYGSLFNAGPISLYIEQNGSLHSEADARVAHGLFVGVVCAFWGVSLVMNALVVRRRERRALQAKEFSLTHPGPQARAIPIRPFPAVSLNGTGAFLTHSGLWPGAILMLAGIVGYVSVHHWMTTRSFAPIDIPVSLQAGHLRTGPFPINLGGVYTLSLTTENERAGYSACAYTPATATSRYGEPALHTHWTLYKNGQVAAESGLSFFWWSADLHGKSGVYDLDVEVLTDVRCLDRFRPRLTVRTDRSEYDRSAFILLWICTLCAGTGASLLVIAGRRRYARLHIPVTPFTQSDVTPANLRWKVPPRKWQSFSAAAWFGLIAVNVQVPLLFVLIVLYPTGERRAGLPVQILRVEKTSQPIPGLDPVVVRMRLTEGEPRPALFVDSLLVPWDDFEVQLQKALRRCPPSWPVYIEGDRDLDWETVATVIDRIKGLHVPVTMLSRGRTFKKSK